MMLERAREIIMQQLQFGGEAPIRNLSQVNAGRHRGGVESSPRTGSPVAERQVFDTVW